MPLGGAPLRSFDGAATWIREGVKLRKFRRGA